MFSGGFITICYEDMVVKKHHEPHTRITMLTVCVRMHACGNNLDLLIRVLDSHVLFAPLHQLGVYRT